MTVSQARKDYGEIHDNLLEIIARKLASLRKSDRRVAEAVLADPQAIPDMRLADLARIADVSEPTVVRFCVAVGCDGFKDFKIKLVRSAALGLSATNAAIEPADDLPTLVKKMFDFNLTNLDWARSRIDIAKLEKAIDLLADASYIEFYGFGASAIVAADAQQKSPLFGVPCTAFNDAHQMLISASTPSPGGVAVGISNTGTSRDIVGVLRQAQSKGMHTIAITGQESAVLRYADVGLVMETLENTDIYTPTISRVAALVLIDLLSTAVSLRRDRAHADRLAEMKRNLADFRMSGTI